MTTLTIDGKTYDCEPPVNSCEFLKGIQTNISITFEIPHTPRKAFECAMLLDPDQPEICWGPQIDHKWLGIPYEEGHAV